jgi:hypothetical protein
MSIFIVYMVGRAENVSKLWRLLYQRDESSVKGSEKGNGCIVLNDALIFQQWDQLTSDW